MTKDKTIAKMIEHVRNEERRLKRNAFSAAIGETVGEIRKKLEQIAAENDEQKKD